MANHHLREVRFQTTPDRAGISFWSKCLCWWMYHVLGYTNFAESVSANSYDPTDNTGVTTGTSASFNATGTDKNLVETGAFSGAGADVGKWVLVVPDVGEEENGGWYRITANPDANTVTLDFRSGAAEYPTQHVVTDMTWFMMAEDNNTPTTTADEWQLRTPHMDGWEIKCILSASRNLTVEMSLDTFTVGVKTLSTKIIGQSGNVDADHIYYYAEGEDSGAHLNFWHFTTDGGGNGGCLVGKLTPFETSPAHSDDELWTFIGHDSVPAEHGEYLDRGISAGAKMWGLVWRDDLRASIVTYIVEWSSVAANVGFVESTLNTINQRTGKNDIKANLTMMADVDNNNDRYEFVGSFGSMFECRENLVKMQTMDDVATKDKVHLRSGFCLPWPGYTPQFAPVP